MPLYTQIRSKFDVSAGFINTYLPYGLSIKLMLGAVLTLLAGPGFLGYISDYATYYYAYCMGVRTPLEGVPYIKAAVTAASVFLLVVSSMIFALSIFVVNSSLNWMKKYFDTSDPIFERIAEHLHLPYKSTPNYETTVQSVRSQEAWVKSLFIVTISLLFTLIIASAEYFVSHHSSGPSLVKFVKIACQFFPIFVYACAVLASLLFPGFLWKLAFSLASSFIVLSMVLMFQSNFYALFLQIIGYGGGIPISLTCKNDASRSDICIGEKSLILRTNETLILLDKDRGVIFEVPKDEFLYVRYDTGGLQTLQAHLPPTWRLSK